MEITVKRWCGPEYTIGKLTIDNDSFTCDTLEDITIDLNKNGKFDGKETKIPGSTSIPFGRYKITLDVISPRFAKTPMYQFCEGKLPRLLDVPHFEGILIHVGNTHHDTDGCILVGKNNIKGMVTNSLNTFKELYAVLQKAKQRGEDIYISFI